VTVIVFLGWAIMSDIVVLGSCSIDLFVRALRLPSVGETVTGSSFKKAFGGKGANQAVQCALLGSRVHFVGRVGDTADGADVLANFKAKGKKVLRVSSCWLSLTSTTQGVLADCICATDSVAAGVALIEVDERTGANRIIVVPGANQLVQHTDLPDKLLMQCGFCVLQLEIPLHATLHAMKRAHQSGVKTGKTKQNRSPLIKLMLFSSVESISCSITWGSAKSTSGCPKVCDHPNSKWYQFSYVSQSIVCNHFLEQNTRQNI
jgi:sugar/nucleoside kinase (ribokinase family)